MGLSWLPLFFSQDLISCHMVCHMWAKEGCVKFYAENGMFQNVHFPLGLVQNACLQHKKGKHTN